jgi:transposase-like protein
MERLKKEKGRKGQKGAGYKYDTALRRKVAMEYINGDLSLHQLSRIYNIPNQNISRWVKEYSSELAEEPKDIAMTSEEQKEFESLKKQNEALKKKLEYEHMRNFALETMIDLAKTELGIDLRKNSGAKQPKK